MSAPKTHGLTATAEYACWRNLKQRCCNPKDPRYPDYGGRGIVVCPRWAASFEAFLADMGPCPPGRSIERSDNGGNYQPGNCYWATPEQQAANRRYPAHPLDAHLDELRAALIAGQTFAKIGRMYGLTYKQVSNYTKTRNIK